MNTATIQIADVAQIDYVYEPHAWRFALEQAAAIDAHWADRAAANPHLFNGRVLVMHRNAIVETDGVRRLEGACCEAQYKAFLAWRDFGCPGDDIRNCFAMAALRSADGAFLLGRMADYTANPGSVYFPAGTPEPGDLCDNRVDLEGSVLREMTEETGFLAEDVTLAPGWTLVLDGPRIACMKTAVLREPAAALLTRFAAHRATEATPELDALVPIFGEADLDATNMPAYMLAYLRDAFRRDSRGAPSIRG